MALYEAGVSLRGRRMSRFASHLDVRLLDGDDGGRPIWMLLAPLVYESDLLARTIEVPPGFVTDFESIPELLAGFSGGKRCNRTGALHDWLYRSHLLGDDEEAKRLSDSVAREAWVVDGLDPIYADQREASVAFYGKSAWASGPRRLEVLT